MTIADVHRRPFAPNDLGDLRTLYPHAFPHEDRLSLVATLLDGTQPVLSLVATDRSTLCAHVAFALCVPDAANTPQAALLARLAVEPSWQGKRLGTGLVR